MTKSGSYSNINSKNENGIHSLKLHDK